MFVCVVLLKFSFPVLSGFFLVSFMAEFGLLIERMKETFHLEWSE